MAFRDVPVITFDDWTDDQTDEGFEAGDCASSGASEDQIALTPLQLLRKYIYNEENVFEAVRNHSGSDPPDGGLQIFRSAPTDLIVKELPDIINLFADLQNPTWIQYLLDKVLNIAEQALESSHRVDALKDLVGDHLLPLLLRNLGNSEASIGRKAEGALIQMIEKGLITKVQIEIKICPVLLALTTVPQDGSTGVNMGVSIKLMSKLAHLLGKDIAERILLPRFIELCSNPNVKKLATSNFGYFCAVVGKEAFEEKLLPLYLSLCQDDLWGVRKSCASVATHVSCACPEDLRRALVARAFAKLLQDDCRWVRMCAFASLGTFLVTFADPKLIFVGYDPVTRDLVLKNHLGDHFVDSQLEGFGHTSWLKTEMPGFLGERRVLSFGEEFGDDFDEDVVTDLDDWIGDFSVKGKNEDKHEDDLLSYNELNYWQISNHHRLEELELTPPTSAAVDRNDNPLVQEADLNKNPAPAPSDTTISDNKPSEISTNQAAPIKEEEEEVEPPQKIVPHDLLEKFISMADPEKFSDGDTQQSCAYVLPAVAVTLGSENWLLLKEITERLAMHMSFKIRKTVASSLHEFAHILGPDLTAEHLSPLFLGFLRDVDEVRIAILSHLHDYLRLLTAEHRVVLLPKLTDFLQVDNTCKWRFHQTLAEQLTECVGLFETKDLKHFGPSAQALLLHNVAAVRKAAILLMTRMVKHIAKEKMRLSTYALMMCQRFALSGRWRARQTFALFCAEVLAQRALDPDQFEQLLLPQLLDLSYDPVPNVRMIVATCITGHLMKSDEEPILAGESLEWLTPVLRKLQTDNDSDVRQCASYH